MLKLKITYSTNKLKQSPATNHLEMLKGAVKGGFDREALVLPVSRRPTGRRAISAINRKALIIAML